MKRTKIIITVRGANIEAVHASPSLPPVELVILDYDIAETGQSFGEDQKVAEGEILNKQVIEIY